MTATLMVMSSMMIWIKFDDLNAAQHDSPDDEDYSDNDRDVEIDIQRPS